MSFKAVYAVGRLEFVRVMSNPIVLLTGLIVAFLAFVNGAGDVGVLEYVSSTYNTDTAVLQGFMQIWEPTGFICMIMVAFFAATTIPYEKWNGSVNVLLAKPLYRRDFVLGKFIGLAMFALFFITFVVLLTGLLIIVFFRAPQSITEYVLRVTAFIIVSSLAYWLVIALNLFFGIVSRNILFVTAAAITYIFIDWIWLTDRFLGALSAYTPKNLYFKLEFPIPNTYPAIFDCLMPFGQWLTGVIPYLVLISAELVVLLLAGVYLFSREDSS